MIIGGIKLNVIIKNIFDYIFPSFCFCCNSRICFNLNDKNNENIDNYFCKKCFDRNLIIDIKQCCKKCGYPTYINENINCCDKFNNDFLCNVNNKQDELCYFCYQNNFKFDKAVSVFKYQGIIRKLILQFKFKYRIDILSLFASQMTNLYFSNLQKADFICFVPITKKKLFFKGFNHSALLANNVYKNILKGSNDCKNYTSDLNNQTKIINDFFIKNNTIDSKKLTQKERISKKHNFFINKKYLKTELKNNFIGKNFLIIDDIMTTGSTLNYASKLIKQNFSNSHVECLTLARTILDY